jgi:hypothetical protein
VTVGERSSVQSSWLKVMLVNAPIFKGLVQTAPAPLEAGRERQLRKRTGLRLGQQGIHPIEQSGCRPLKTLVDLVTKLVPCVKVHLSNAPFGKLPEHYSYGQAFAKRVAHLPMVV